jgi:opacity protein-like surface antigen
MRKAITIAAILALFFPSVLSALHHTETTNVQKAEVTADMADIFLEASQHSIVIDTIPKGAVVTLFPSGKRDKKWLYISYLSKKRGSQVTGFVESRNVEVIGANPPEEPENPADEVLTSPKNEDSAPEETPTQNVETKSEELRNLLEEMKKDKKPKETVRRELAEGELEVVSEEREDQEKKNPDTTEKTEAETIKSQEGAAQKETADTVENSFPKKEDKAEVPADDGNTVEQAQEPEIEELPKVLTKVSVKVPRANIRLMPTTKSAIIQQVRSGVELEHVAKTGNWHRVNLEPDSDGLVLSGYIHHNIVDEIFETSSPPPEPGKNPEPGFRVIEKKPEPEPEPEPVQEVPTLRRKNAGKYYWMGGGAGYTMPSESRFGKGISIGGTFGFGMTKHLALELKTPYFQSDVIGTAGGLSSGHLSSFSLMLSVQGRYPIKNRFVPYLVAGGDYHLNTFRLNEKINQTWDDLGFDIQENVNNVFGIHLGVGLDVFLKDNIAFNVDVRYYTANLTGERTLANQISQETTSGTLDDMKLNSFQAGISFKFFLNPLARKK